MARLTAEMNSLGLAAKEGVTALGKVKTLEAENKKFLDENKVLTENYNSERVCACCSYRTFVVRKHNHKRIQTYITKQQQKILNN